MEIFFLTIIGCHIPYIFFSGKEALLIVVDEIMRKSISLDLNKKLLKTQEKIENDVIPLVHDDKLSVSDKKTNKLGYKSMNPVIYYSLTLILYFVELILSIYLNNIG